MLKKLAYYHNLLGDVIYFEPAIAVLELMWNFFIYERRIFMNVCPKCGVTFDTALCPYCGIPANQNNQQSPKLQTNGFGITSLVLGILGIITSIFCIGSILGIIGLIFGLLALKRPERKKGTAIAGIILGILSVIICIVFFGAIIFFK